MTEETVDCFNCGRANPEWAQVCRSCGVQLRHGEARVAPSGRIPTDQASLISIGAVLGTIVLAVMVGLFVSNLNPTEPTVGQGSPSPSVSIAPSVAPSVEPEPSASASATPRPTPQFPGRLRFGTAIDDTGRVTETAREFTPSMPFAYSVTLPGGFGVDSIENEVIRRSDGVAVIPRQAVAVSPDAETYGYVLGEASTFIAEWGSGQFQWRTYVNGELVARKGFRFSEG